MHDDSTAGKATADRTLAYWTDPSNFAAEPRRMGSPVPATARVEEPAQDDTKRAWYRGYWFGQVMANQNHIKTTWY